MKELTLLATVEALDDVQAFIEGELELANAPMKTMLQISICVEELYVNIANYAYNPSVGDATIRCILSENPSKISIQFEDGGVPFDPLAKEDADTTLTAEEREIGGLGILMVKRSMDCVTYAYENGKNIFTMEKSWSE